MKLLVVQPGKIGVMVVTTSLFNTLYENFGACDVAALAFTHDLIKRDPRVREVLDISVSAHELRRRKYTHALILMPDYRLFILCRLAGIKNIYGTVHGHLSWRERLASFLLSRRFHFEFNTSAEEHYLGMAKALGAQKIIHTRSLHTSVEDEAAVARITAEYHWAGKKLIGMSIAAGKSFKEWDMSKYAALTDWLIEEGYTVVGVGSSSDTPKLSDFQSRLQRQERFVNLAGRLPLREFAVFSKSFICFIAADTGPMHIADTQGVPVIDIMGPCPSASQRPVGTRAVIVGECLNPSHPKCYMMNCPYKHADAYTQCMSEITLEEVKQAVEKVIMSDS